jgi:peptidoglycan hydrolase CwlO-like protein
MSDALPDNSVLIATISAAIGMLASKLFDFILSYVKTKQELKLTDREQLISEYKDLIDELQNQVSDMMGGQKELHRHYLDSKIENAGLKIKLAQVGISVDPSDSTKVSDIKK